jgi:hypothetical protein
MKRNTALLALFVFLFLAAGSMLQAQVPAPANLTATLVTGDRQPEVKLSWDGQSNPAPSISALTYNVYRKEGDTGSFKLAFPRVFGHEVTDFQVLRGTTYSYYVVAQKRDSLSANSAIVSITVPALAFGTISGTVTTDADGTPLDHVNVGFVGADGYTAAPCVMTDSLGKFTAKLQVGDYTISFSKPGYIPEYYDNQPTWQTATKVTVNNGDALVITAGLAKFVPPVPAYIYGVVTADSNGAPLSRVDVRAIGSSLNYGGPHATTDAQGKYVLRVDAGDYVLAFSKPGFTTEFYNNQTTFENATKLTIKGGDSVAVNVGLAGFVPPTAYTVSGVVTDANGVGLKATVSVFKLRNNTYHVSGQAVRTDSTGHYAFKALQNDTVVVFAASGKAYVPQYYNNQKTYAEATRIAVTGNVTDINFALALKPVLPNGISGVITDSAKVGVAAHVDAYPVLNGRPGKAIATISDSLGNYAFANIPVGNYILRVFPLNGYRPTYYKYDGSQAFDWKKADSVAVDSIQVTTNINFTVVPRVDTGFGGFHGTVRANGAVVAGVSVYVVDAAQNFVSYGITDAKGAYKMNDVAAGVYHVITDMPTYNSTSSTAITISAASSSASVDLALSTSSVNAVTSDNSGKVAGFSLEQNYPNPFNPTTNIRYSVAALANVKLSVYDILGREIATLVNENQVAGTYNVVFNASKLTSGIYFYKLQVGSQTITKKLTLLK